MRRRHLLTVAGALLAAGCNTASDEPTTGTTTESPRPTPTESGTPTRTERATDTRTRTETPTDTPTESPTETATESPTETATETPTETETPTPDPAVQEAATHIETAREKLGEALDAFLAFGGEDNDSLTVVDASTDDFSFPPVTNPVSDATDALDQIPDGATDEQEQTASDLREVGVFLDHAARAQMNMTRAFAAVETAREFYYDEAFDTVGNARQTMTDEVEEARDELATIEDNSGSDAIDSFDRLSQTDYIVKRDQLEREADTVAELESIFGTLIDAMRSFGTGINSYLGDTPRRSENDFREAENSFTDATDSLDSLSAAEPFRDGIDELLSVTEALEAGSVDLEAAAAAIIRGDESEKNDREDDARAQFQSSEIASNQIEPVERFLRETAEQ